ncbi:MAG: mechanosensitive ion channel family protein [Candidatus Midichloriaceae bacterium]
MNKIFPFEVFLKNDSLIYVLVEVLLIIIIGFIINKVVNKFYRKFEKAGKTTSIYKIVIFSIKIPLKILIWVLVASYIVVLVNKFLNFDILHSVLLGRKIIFIFLLGLFLFKLIHEYELYSKRMSTLTNRANIPIGTFCRILKIIVIIFALLTLIETSGINISGLLAFGSVSGIILGFASKDLLANFFGATLIYLDKPFEIGDWVRSPDKNIEGTVESISWRLTKIRTFDKRPLYVPNSIFNTIVIENASRMSHRRIREVIGIRYCDIGAVTKIIDDVKNMLARHEEIASDQTMIVNLTQFNQSSVDFMVYTFTKTTNWIKYQEVKQDVLLKISEIIDKNKAEMAFPTRTVHLESNYKGPFEK